jgi:two-component SAPR family response regulator
VSQIGDGRLVLAVDDELSIRRLLELTLAASGYAVIVFERAQDALEELRGGLHPDVILSDVTMPGLDGFGFYQQVRQLSELRAVPFLFLTALNDRAFVRQGMALGADDYLTKPFDRSELIGAVARRIERFAEIREPAADKLRVCGFGTAFVERGSKRLEWDSLKSLELLFYLLENRSGASTFEVAEALWPGKTEARASSSFHTTLYRLRKAVGGEVVQAANRRYFLHSDFRVDYDVESYREAATRARSSHREADYRRAADLYRDDFLINIESDWVEEIRLALHTTHLELLVAAAERAEREGHYEAATDFYTAITRHEPYSESAWESLAELLERRGQRSRAAQVRERFASIIDEF